MNNNTNEQVLSMRYINDTLLKSEKLIYCSRPHWIIFAPSVLALVVAMLFYCCGPFYFALRLGFFGGYQLYEIFSLIAAVVGAYWFLEAFIRYKTSEYGVTDKRVLMKTGWIQRNTMEIFLMKLEALNVNQTIPGRLFNYGTVIVIGTGGTQDYYPNVPDPLGFRKIVQRQAELLSDRDDRR